MNKRSLVLPSAILLGLLLHRWCACVNGFVPYLIFAILVLNFSAVRLKTLRPGWLDVILMSFQIAVSLLGYFLVKWLGGAEPVAQGLMLGIICPVAASVPVVACMLGADRRLVTTYSMMGNLMVCLVAPIFFSFVGNHQDMPFLMSFWLIFKKIVCIIGIPFFLVLLLQRLWPRLNDSIARFKGASFYLWAFALFLTFGKTIDYVFAHWEGNVSAIVWLAVLSVLACALQFGLGKLIGGRFGDRMAGGQLLGQKNSAMGIWMSNTFLDPLSAVFMAFYSVWQNLFNSWQIWYFDPKKRS